MGMTLMKNWPCRVYCYRRRYEAPTQQELNALIYLLENRALEAANRYRVGNNRPCSCCRREKDK